MLVQRQTLMGIVASFIIGSLVTALVFVYSQSTTEDLVVIHITRGDPLMPEEIHPATMGVKTARGLQDEGRDVTVVLNVRGVYIALKNPSGNLVEANDSLKKVLDGGGRVIVCEGCLNKAGYETDDLLDGVEILTTPKFSEILTSRSTVISF